MQIFFGNCLFEYKIRFEVEKNETFFGAISILLGNFLKIV